MPWYPELFSAPAVARIEARRRPEPLESVPFFDGLMTGEFDALIGSFAGTPEHHHPVRGRVTGDAAFARLAGEMTAWLERRDAAVEDVNVIVTPSRSVEEVVLHLDAGGGRIALPVAIVNDRDERRRIVEQRMYFSTWPLRGTHAIRPPVLQPSPPAKPPGVVRDYHRALAAGDADAVVAAFAPDASVREPAGGAFVHRGPDALRALFGRFFANAGGISLEHCTATDDGRACALEYNVVAWGETRLPPQAGVAVYVHDGGGTLTAARIYDDVDPPPAVLAS